jgi:hypothetical protein
MNEEDVLWIVEYLEKYQRDLHKHRSLDMIAAQCTILGLMAYGWTLTELCLSKSPLIEEVQKYINIDEDSEFSKEMSLKRSRGDDVDAEYPKRQRTACGIHANNSVSDKTTKDQRPNDYSLSTAGSSPSSETTVFSGSEHPVIADGSAASIPATSFDLHIANKNGGSLATEKTSSSTFQLDTGTAIADSPMNYEDAYLSHEYDPIVAASPQRRDLSEFRECGGDPMISGRPDYWDEHDNTASAHIL